MSDELRAVLTEALKAHQVYQCSRSSWDDESIQWWQCHGCDFKSNTFPIKGINWVVLGEEIAANHQADVIASLPGVAVIQLPEPDVDEYGNTTFADGTVVTFKDGWTQLRLEDIGRDDCYDWDDDQLRDFGAALLAAAAAAVAEGEDRE
ncbi:hypothetical protein SEA_QUALLIFICATION_43 [Mycobacterium phage Quallification]|nr:hypothetical protein SEA_QUALLIFICATION_43 [Mycobacterium phage Quallification]